MKILIELIERIKEIASDQPPGEVLQNIYSEYIMLKKLAKVLADTDGNDTETPVSDLITTHILEEGIKYEE